MSNDSSELKALRRDLGKIPANMVPKVRGVVAKGALQIKKDLQKDLSKSSSFRVVARAIDYDLINNVSTGTATFAAEIGPNKDRHAVGSLANIAYFGGIHGGGGTVRDPAEALADEVPVVVEFLEKAVEGLL